MPSLVVLHYTAMQSFTEARERLCDPAYEVSAHWLIGEDGRTEALVPEAARAWHAGAGAWAGRDDVNSQSIGIELANPSTHPFPEPQMAALEQLLAGILRRWQIPAHRVIAHSDMAPGRKSDPGPRFDWRRLAAQGLSVWPDPEAPQAAPAGFRDAALRFGYPAVEDALLLAAFRLRFRPWAQGPLSAVDASAAADLARRFPGSAFTIDGAGAQA
ncbi:N-acetylmuramoyl-L-alanine amidase [Xinfangfangia sp. CPCC 101601]|uniref:N-acetylmuramoyl-L-alanine amidase n=1 Tax=Pseudogemmobacter lacusdianii TaxID=3069608 RepID=A0ABU0VT73_9RHOB|nr:N-acetylmuramoyl-L-alanine amidase [Xinfangfangia sp. CPCC 101601]MDQ2064868.1 N-acetylmuramoyl-L-alanine amidase [Xinfangfangia sp. CPCC 101601]